MDLIEALHWRYATKKMDPTRKVPDESIARIIEATRLAPSSSGLQPYELIAVSDPAWLARIRPIAAGQSQIEECSCLLVFAAWDDYTAERIQMMHGLAASVRGPSEGSDAYHASLIARYPARGAEINFQHAARQAYIGLGFALAAAAAEGVDSTPMEGFDASALDALLGLRERGLRSVAIMPLGYRHHGVDWLEGLAKVRRPASAFVTEIKPVSDY